MSPGIHNYKRDSLKELNISVSRIYPGNTISDKMLSCMPTIDMFREDTVGKTSFVGVINSKLWYLGFRSTREGRKSRPSHLKIPGGPKMVRAALCRRAIDWPCVVM